MDQELVEIQPGKVLLAGIDVGSTTTKIAAVNPENGEVVYSDYRRHHANQVQSIIRVLEGFQEKFPGVKIEPALTGSGAKPIAEKLKIPFIQEWRLTRWRFGKSTPLSARPSSWEARTPRSFSSEKTRRQAI